MTGTPLTDDEITAIAEDFESTDFTPEDIAKIKKTRRRSPRLGHTKTEVLAPMPIEMSQIPPR